MSLVGLDADQLLGPPTSAVRTSTSFVAQYVSVMQQEHRGVSSGEWGESLKQFAPPPNYVCAGQAYSTTLGCNAESQRIVVRLLNSELWRRSLMLHLCCVFSRAYIELEDLAFQRVGFCAARPRCRIRRRLRWLHC
eukprot:SAG11_NODE_21757_length_419_cov_0.971875_1_plen_135_part_01